MSQEYDNTNRGVLFKNDRKESANHPDYKGQIDVDGVEFWLSAWIKEGKNGKFMSLSIKPKDEQRAADPPQRNSRPPERSPGQRAARPAPAPAPRGSSGSGFDDMSDDAPW